MEEIKIIKTVARNPFYEDACEMVSEDIEDFQECLRLNTLNNRMKDEYETFKCYVNFKYAVKERMEIELGSEDGIELVRFTRDVLLNICEGKNIAPIKKVEPQWLDIENRWGWKVIYQNEKEAA